MVRQMMTNDQGSGVVVSVPLLCLEDEITLLNRIQVRASSIFDDCNLI